MTSILKLLHKSEKLVVHRYHPNQNIQELITPVGFWSVTKTPHEISLIVPMDTTVPPPIKSEPDWDYFQVEGVLDFGLVGIIAKLTNILATKGIPVFVVSTFDTDYILVKSNQAQRARDAWRSLEGVVVE